MKAVVFEGENRGSIQDKPVPKLDDGEVLIQVDLCGVCASDLAAIRGEVTDYSPPVVLGHEVAGTVSESRHPSVKVGQKVTVNPMIPVANVTIARRTWINTAVRSSELATISTVDMPSISSFPNMPSRREN